MRVAHWTLSSSFNERRTGALAKVRSIPLDWPQQTNLILNLNPRWARCRFCFNGKFISTHHYHLIWFFFVCWPIWSVDVGRYHHHSRHRRFVWYSFTFIGNSKSIRNEMKTREKTTKKTSAKTRYLHTLILWVRAYVCVSVHFTRMRINLYLLLLVDRTPRCANGSFFIYSSRFLSLWMHISVHTHMALGCV